MLPKAFTPSRSPSNRFTNPSTTYTFGYVQAAVRNVNDYLRERHRLGDKRYSFPAKVQTPIRTSYRPELDVSPELGPTESAYYQSLIGTLRWIVKLGRVDICLEV